MKRISYVGLGIALVCIATMLVQIPIPATKGYLNLGDSVIMVLAVLFGARFGLFVGSLGSALADVLTGYAYWAPATFIIKGLEGLIVGLILAKGKKSPNHFRIVCGLVCGALVMAFGYFFAGAIMYGWAVSAADMVANLVQGFGSTVIALPLIYALKRLRFLDKECKDL